MPTKKNKIYSHDQIMNKYVKTVMTKKIQILFNAIDIMKENNSLTKFDCVALAMGYELFETDPNTYREIGP